MINGANRKEKGRMVQFRAPIEYGGALELIMELINRKITDVGSTEKMTISDVMKLSIECLVKGTKTVEILGREFVVSELIQQELEDFQDISTETVEKEVKFYLMTKLHEIIEVYEGKMEGGLLDENEAVMLKILNAVYCTREEVAYSLSATEEEREVLGLKSLDTVEDYLTLLCASYSLLNLKFDMKLSDFDGIRKYVEVALFEGEHATKLQALKLFDQYRYCYILNALRRHTEAIIDSIEAFFLFKDNSNIEKSQNIG